MNQEVRGAMDAQVTTDIERRPAGGDRLQVAANVAQIVGLVLTAVGVFIQVLMLNSPEAVMGMVGNSALMRSLLLALGLVAYAGFVVLSGVLLWRRRPDANGPMWPAVLFGVWTAILFFAVGIAYATKPPLTCAGYGIKIAAPEPGAPVGSEVVVTGSYSAKPPAGRLVLYTAPLTYAAYSPGREVQYDTLRKRWIGTVLVDYSPQARILVALVGDSGRVLYDYYWDVRREREVWRPLGDLTEDTLVCDEVMVRLEAE